MEENTENKCSCLCHRKGEENLHQGRDCPCIKFNYEEKLTLMRNSTDKRMKIIALYWTYKGWRFQNQLQYKKALIRELRASRDLLGFTSQQITETMDFCDKEFEMWTMETVGSRIEDVVLR